MNYYYAQLSDINLVIGISDLSGEVKQENMISISSYDLSLLGKIWNPSTKEFIDNPNPPTAGTRHRCRNRLQPMANRPLTLAQSLRLT